MKHGIITTMLFCLLSACGAGLAQAQLGDVTYVLTYLGNPTQSQWPDNTPQVFARNMWVTREFSGRLYLGSGDVASNPGPVYIRTFTLATGIFATETIDGVAYALEEELSNFRMVGGAFVTLGIDPQESWDFGNYYGFAPDVGAWHKYRNIPNGIHVLDMTLDLYAPKLLVAGTMLDPSSGVKYSWDGATWTDVTCNGGPCPYGRYYRFFALAGKLYVQYRESTLAGRLYEYVSATNDLLELSSAITSVMMPNNARRLSDNQPFAGGIVYLAGGVDLGFHPEPTYLMYATAMGTASSIALPRPTFVPRDLLVIGNTLYLLQHSTTGSFWSTVWKTTDLVTWTEVMFFKTIPGSGFARSFTHANGYFYFGLGTYTTPLSNASGWLVRIAYTP